MVERNFEGFELTTVVDRPRPTGDHRGLLRGPERRPGDGVESIGGLPSHHHRRGICTGKSEGDGTRIGCGHGADEIAAGPPGFEDQGIHEVAIGEDPVAEGLVGVHFDQDRRAIDQRKVSARKAGQTDPGPAHALGRVVSVDERHIGPIWVAGLCGGFEDRRQVFRDPGIHGGIEERGLGDHPGQHPLVVGAVGDVVVDVEVGSPGMIQGGEGGCLGAGKSEVVAVEVEPARGRAEAHALNGAVLIRPVVGRDAFVTVEIVDWDKEGDRGFCEIGAVPHGDFPQQHERCILAVDLAGVDSTLEQEDGFAGGFGRVRGERAVGRDDHERQLAALGRSTETGDSNDIGCAGLDAPKEVHGLGEGRSCAEVGFLRHRLPDLRDIFGDCEAGEERDEGDEAEESFHGPVLYRVRVRVRVRVRFRSRSRSRSRCDDPSPRQYPSRKRIRLRDSFVPGLLGRPRRPSVARTAWSFGG